MLTPEQAKERLKEFQIPDPKARLRAAAGLTEAQRTVAYGLLGRDAQGAPLEGTDWPKRQAFTEAVHRQLLAFGDADRLAVFGVFFPTLAPHVEAAWRFHDRLPYQSGGARKPFRAPQHPVQADAARIAWFQRLLAVAQDYEGQPLAWFAAWAPHIAHYHGDALGILLAAAIDRGDAVGNEVFDILVASARGEHEVGVMGRHVTRALLAAPRPDGWDFLEKFLLAAQRQEGLRQVILEAVDEAHPEAFRRMLRVIRENDLTRFSATIRAVDVWLGFGWDAMSARFAAKALAQIEEFLNDPAARNAAVTGDDLQAAYFALWATAFDDAPAAVALAQALLTHTETPRRFVAAYLLVQTGLPEAADALLPLLDDPDLRVALLALSGATAGGDLFERLERLVDRLPAKPKTLDPLVWDWTAQIADRAAVADRLPAQLGDRPPSRLIPYLPVMNVLGRCWTANVFAEQSGDPAVRDPAVRDALLRLIGDPAEYVRDKALEAIKKTALAGGEAPQVEALLTRKAGDLRRGVLSLLLAQPDAPAQASARRLLAARDPLPRQAGLELLAQMVKNDRSAPECRALAGDYRATAAKTTEAEDAVLDRLLDVAREEPTLDNGLGLFDPQDCTPRVAPVLPEPPTKWVFFPQKPEPFVTPAARALHKSLDDLIRANREQPVSIPGHDEKLLGNVRWGFPRPDYTKPVEEDWERLPLADLWLAWWESRPADQRDPDGLELTRALGLFYKHSSPGNYFGAEADAEGKGGEWIKEMRETLFGAEGAPKLHADLVQNVLFWLMRRQPQDGVPDLLLRAAEVTGALGDKLCPTGWRDTGRLTGWMTFAGWHLSQYPDAWTPEQRIRWWRLAHWQDRPHDKAIRMRPTLDTLLNAHVLGAANDADLLDQLIGPRPQTRYGHGGFDELRALTGRRPVPLLETHPALRDALERVRARVLDVELTRGELPTAASAPALALRSVEGTTSLIRLLRALGANGFSRGQSYSWRGEGQSKGVVFSHLARISFPAPADTPEDFARQVKDAGIGPKRLIELAVYAPQWAGFVQRALGWPEFAEAVWWLHAHTKDAQWSVDQEIRDLWTAQAAERTPLSAQSLLDGAVDVAWFARIYRTLGAERWGQVDEAAKYASGGGGHKRAQLFADAMLGRLTKEAVVTRIKDKRHPDSVRALGLLPLAGGKAREADLLDRYQTMQEFGRGSRQFGAMRQASEKAAMSVGLENLARTAGYPDPVRLEWAMEAEAVADLAAGPVTASAGDVTVTLSINEWGTPNLAVTKNGKPLKALPPAAKKVPEVAALTARKTEIERQASRMRLSLEGAMCRGDGFTGAELSTLLEHPVLAPMLRSLVLVGDGLAGYPLPGGKSLEGLGGEHPAVGPKTALRLAHPHDLLLTGQWSAWQHDCFTRERIQPFKQVFRELYVLTGAERDDHDRSQRYAGHQVNKSQAFALLGKRGWVGSPYEGDVRRTFHDVGLTAALDFDYGYTTPAEVEGLTIARVVFTRRGEWKALPLDQVPPRVFSEAMRDVDLVVSVAHQGGVDPEASASTVEMRASLLREACGLLKMPNVRLQGSHALIDGQLGTYSVHLGSAIVHRQPGGQLCIVPVHSQHRGRVFLPFADDDPRTAEVLSKVLLLAKDTEIKDPVILEQIYA